MPGTNGDGAPLPGSAHFKVTRPRMNAHRCLKIAERISVEMTRALGQGIDGRRMVHEPLYARDVLLVCDALPGTELALLAGKYRRAANEADEAPPPSGPASLWGASRFLSSLFGAVDEPPQPPRRADAAARRDRRER